MSPTAEKAKERLEWSHYVSKSRKALDIGHDAEHVFPLLQEPVSGAISQIAHNIKRKVGKPCVEIEDSISAFSAGESLI